MNFLTASLLLFSPSKPHNNLSGQTGAGKTYTIIGDEQRIEDVR